MKVLLVLLGIVTSSNVFSIEKIQPDTSKPTDVVEVVIKGGIFEPDVIGVHSKKSTKINFVVKDDSLCKEKIVIRQLGVEIPISKGKVSSIVLKDKKPGKYHIECETGVFCGVLFIFRDKKDQPKHYYVPEGE